MDRLKVILVHDGSRGSTASFDQGALPEGIEIVGSLRIDGLSAGNNPRDGQPSMSDKAGLHPRISGEADLHPGVSEDIAGLVQRGSKHQVPDRVFPLSEPGGIEERPVRLTRTELEVLRLLAKGQQNKEIANEMYISVNTVKSHVSSILRKLRVRNRAQAVRYVYRCGMRQ
ncbi:MAG: response regulator transcription factor [Firmicutes bacterium]|nr:response regulator transcription factor [Bacillota bacterium]